MAEEAAAVTGEKPVGPVHQLSAATATPDTAAGAELVALDDDVDAADTGGEGGDTAAAADNSESAERPAWARPDDEKAGTEWREERGIPAEADDYSLPIADPDHLDDSAHQTIKGFKQVAHKYDLPQEATASMYEFATTRAQEIMAARI